MKRFLKKTGQLFEAATVWLVLKVFAAMSLDRASAVGGAIARTIGPHLPVSRVAQRNLARAIPETSVAEARRIIRGMWENIGRTLGEYPHIGTILIHEKGPRPRIQIIRPDIIDLLRDDGKTGIFFSAHLANWEILVSAGTQSGVRMVSVYRAANNRLVEEIFQRYRDGNDSVMAPKGAEGGRRVIAEMKGGRHLALLVDQKMNDGIPVPFFGLNAMTAPALVRLADRFDCPVVPARIERLEGARFRLTLYPPLALERDAKGRIDAHAAMTQVNDIVEGWIRERPDQWLWLHRRWPKEDGSSN